MGLSRRAYAALRGVHESAVRKAIATGRITTEADGTIDAVKADAMWDASTNPAKQRGAQTRAPATGWCFGADRQSRPAGRWAIGRAHLRRIERWLRKSEQPG